MQPSEKQSESYSPGTFGINNALRGRWGGWLIVSFAAFASGLLWQLAVGFPAFGSDDWMVRSTSGRPVSVEPAFWGMSFAAMALTIVAGILGNVFYFISADTVPTNPRPRAYVKAYYLVIAAYFVLGILIAMFRFFAGA